ncbi:MAG: DUF1343 domain-containing protein [Bacteroidota bacterium]
MISFGIDNLLEGSPSWKKERIGLVTNHAATTNLLTPSREALLKNGFNIQMLFSPEHGLDVQGADGCEMKNGTDTLTGLPVTSLYSTKLAPSKEDLDQLDLVLFDIPDIGSRFYTYLWTMTHVMEACAKYQKKLIILDRPNPISGNLELAEGPVLEEAQASFIGRWPIPVRHSCTLGELALYFNAVKNIRCDLEVIKCKDWERNQMQPDWGIRFVPTSPAIQSFESMLLYPGLCLLEATNTSEGRGTDYSFCSAGAPWIKGEAIAGILNEMGLDDVLVTPVHFTPSDNHAKFVGEKCGGVQFEVREAGYFQSVSFGLLLIRLIKQMYPKQFAWKPYPTLVNPSGTHHLDKLLGIASSEDLFSLPLPQFIAAITRLTQCSSWKDEVKPFLQYGRNEQMNR